MLCAPTMQQANNASQMCGNGIPALWCTYKGAQKPTAPPAAPPTACCGLVVRTPGTTCKRPRHKTKQNAATTATVAIRVRRFPQLPTSTQRAEPKLLRVHWMRRSTVSSDAPAVRNISHASFELACACQSKVVPPAWQEYGAFPTSSVFPLVRGGKREHVRFSAGL